MNGRNIHRVDPISDSLFIIHCATFHSHLKKNTIQQGSKAFVEISCFSKNVNLIYIKIISSTEIY